MNLARKPDVVCIGAQKAGTSWLHETLATREDIWVPPFKELHFFDHKFVDECRRWAPWHVKKGIRQARNKHLSETHQPDQGFLDYLEKLEERPILNGTWYKFVFSRAAKNQTCLDVTPEYSCIPNSGVDFFKRFLPDAKILYIVRKPCDRLMSQLRMNAHRKQSTSLTEKDWFDLLEMSALHSRGDYLNIIPRWDNRFSEDQLLYIPYGKIRTEPTKVLRSIEYHCDLPEREYKTARKRIHETEPLKLPEFVIEKLQDMAKPQDEFLLKRFGEHFFNNTA